MKGIEQCCITPITKLRPHVTTTALFLAELIKAGQEKIGLHLLGPGMIGGLAHTRPSLIGVMRKAERSGESVSE